MENGGLNQKDLVDNPNPRLPICLCLDTSGSMRGKPIKELNSGVSLLMHAIREDEIAKYSAEIAVVTFGDEPSPVCDFEPIDGQEEPHLEAYGETIMGGGVSISLDLLNKRRKTYSSLGVDYYKPWLVLISDGRPGDNIRPSVGRIHSLADDGKITVFAIGVGNDADMEILNKYSPQRRALRMNGLRFREFFSWLSDSVNVISRSMPGEDIELDTESIDEWAKV